VDGKRDEPSVQIVPDDTRVAPPGDHVFARVYRGVAGKQLGERVGRVVEILKRGRASQKHRQFTQDSPGNQRYSVRLLAKSALAQETGFHAFIIS
jgi:hypothetical protein